MITDTDGIVLRQVKTSYNRRMISLFTKKYGKISAGTGIGDKGKSKSTLALRPFTYGHYELFKSRDSYSINKAETLKAYYRIGEDVDKYMNGAYVLEFTEKVLSEGQPLPGAFNLLMDFFEELEQRNKAIGTLVLGYQVKLLGYTGVMPELDRCTVCSRPINSEGERSWFSIENGGLVCSECGEATVKAHEQNSTDNSLIYHSEFGIIDVLKYYKANPLRNLRNIALNASTGKLLQQIVREYAAYHLDASDIKSEQLI